MRLSIIIFSLFIISSCTDVVDSALSDSAPVISFSANPSSVVIGSSTSLLWSSSQASSCLASGAWSGEKSISGSEKVIISSIGNQSFYLSCSGNGGSSFSVVTIEGYRETEGVVVDGYISGASVFIDENENFVVDDQENITTSDSEGRFSIKYADGNLISLGGTDLDSQTLLDNLLITHKIQGHTDFKVITPITSVAAFLDDSSIINTALGIDASIDIFSFDPVINKGDNGINDYLFEKGNQITILAFALQNIVNDLNATNETTQDFYRAISNELEAEFLNTGTKVDIETDTFITNVIENIFTTKSISIDDIVKANIVTALAGVLPVIQVQSTDNLTTAVIRFGLSTLQNDIVDFANGTATHELISSYSSDILNYIADDQNIDSNQITPNIVAIDDIAKVNEDESVIINVVANDSYTTTSPITLTAGNGEHGSTMLTESSPQQMIYVPNTDFYGADAFNYTIAQGDKTSSAEVVVTISPVNDDPSIDIASILSIPENQKFVTNVSVSDADKDILSLTLGGIDAASFNLTSENILRFKENPDFETKTSYGITLFASDGINEVTKDITINVTDKYEGFSLKKSYTVNEGDSLQLISIHKDNGFTVTFQKLQILSGNSDSLSMTSSGLITGFDFEQSGSSTTVVVEATDGTSTITNQVMEIIVANINEAPVFTSSATFSAAENQTAIGTVTATDADGDTLTYSLSGTDSGSVSINSSSGVLTFNSAPDYETKSSYSATVTASDGTNSTTQNITVNVTNVNDNTPSITSSATFSAAENQTAIGTVTATDADGDTITYSVSGTDASSMSINSSSGVLTFNSAPDYETKSSYSATVTASDGTNSTTQNVTIAITDVNEAPVFTSSATFSAAENQTAIGTVTATDADGDTLTFSLSGTDASSMSINSSSGVLTFNSAPDYETKSSYSATVTASDGSNSATQAITVLVTDTADAAPVFTSSATFSAAENQTAIGTVTATDADGDTITYSVSGTDSGSVSINSSSGVLTFNSAPDYEAKSSYSMVVTASDGTNSTTQNVTIAITDVNEAPVFTSSATFSAAENQTAIGTVTTTDAEGDTVTYSVSSSDSSVAINTSSGLLVFNSAPDYEAKSSHSMVVTASDGTNSTTQNITVNVTNVNDNTPSITSSATFSVAENQTAIGTVTATDADGDALTYSISSASANTNNAFPQDDHASLDETDYYVVSPSTGQSVTLRVYDIDDQMKVTFKNSSGVVQQELTYSGSGSTINVLDYITADGSTIELELTNGAAGYTMAWELSIAGSVVNSNSCGQYNQFGCAGNSSSSGVVYETTIYLGDTSSDILVDADTGVLTFNSAPNYETKSSYTASVTASDGSLTATQSITVNVTDVNDAPTATAANYYMNLLPQDQTSGVITLSGTDEDGDTLTYSIVSNGSYGTASLSGATVTYQTNANTQSAQSESFTFKVNDGTLDSSAATISIDLRTDPLYQYQWHLNNTGQTNFATNGGTSGVDLNVDTVIAGGITGDGVKVSIVDDGLELAHEDLIDNVISGSWDFVNADSDPTQPSTYAGGGHGTSVAGLIAAVGWNNKGVRGIAPEASIFGANFIENQASGNEAKALGVNSPGGVTADIYNMSYGYGVGGSSYNLRSFLTSTNEAKFVNGVENLRGGKGALYIKSSGNDYGSSSTNMCGTGQPLSCTETTIDETNQSPYVVVVGALDADGVKTTYSTPGSSVWVSGFGGEYGYDSSIFSGLSDNIYDPAMMTVDRSSCSLGYSRNDTGGNRFNREGYNYTEQTTLNSDCNYNSSFNGTSSAAPTVSGVIALMLEANPNLTWRDVKHLLVTTSDKVDASRTHTQQGLVQYGWTQNSAGYEHHNWYGFGQINASAAVTAAQSYTANSRGTWASSGYQSSGTLNVSLPDLTVTSNAISVTKPNGSNDFVEFVRVSLSFNHASAKTVGVRLTSPDGTTINLMQPYTNVNNPGSISFDIGVSGFYGESIEGNWTIDLTDYVGDDVTGILSNWGIEVWGN